MMTIAITAPTGMLGSMVYNVLKDKYRLVLIYRDAKKMDILNKVYGGVWKHRKIKFDLLTLLNDYVAGFVDDTVGPETKKLFKEIGNVDGFINCAGIIKPWSTVNPLSTLFINGILPHIFSSQYGERLIQITTDCVYNGLGGAPYTESSPKTPNDLYGISKSVGEPHECSLVFRTSIIGPEISNEASLLEWLRKQDGKEVLGYTNHLWNGLTTREFANICDKIFSMRSGYPSNGLFHLFSTDVSKYEILLALKEKYHLDVKIQPKEHTILDRRLWTDCNLCRTFSIPSFQKMVDEL